MLPVLVMPFTVTLFPFSRSRGTNRRCAGVECHGVGSRGIQRAGVVQLHNAAVDDDAAGKCIAAPKASTLFPVPFTLFGNPNAAHLFR